MADVWPIDLPQAALPDNYSEAVGDGVVEYQPDVGPSIVRRRSAAAPRALTVSFEMTSAQLLTLRIFFDTTLLGGALPFLFPAPTESATYLVRFQKGAGPKWAALGGDYFNVTMTLWVLP